MMNYPDAVAVVRQLIDDNARGFDWLAYPQFKYTISEKAKHLSIRVLEDPANLIADQSNPGVMIPMAEALRRAVSNEIGCCVRRDYLYRLLSLALDDDDNHNHITIRMLRAAKKYRTNVLKMDY